MTVAVILGSAFDKTGLDGVELQAHNIRTQWGAAELHRAALAGREAWVLFRHGLPHSRLPNQVNYRAQAAALKKVGCQALLITSSVGVLDSALPLYQPLLLSDLLMPDNRLPDGSACTMWPQPAEDHGHLVLGEGLFSVALGEQVRAMAEAEGAPIAGAAVFAYVGGPRTKTRAENHYWAAMGAQVNSMTVGPEVVLANEQKIACAALVVGHKHSNPNKDNPADRATVAESLVHSRRAMQRIVLRWLREAQPAAFGNHLYRF